jgi:hypothetical protein
MQPHEKWENRIWKYCFRYSGITLTYYKDYLILQPFFVNIQRVELKTTVLRLKLQYKLLNLICRFHIA